MALSTFGVALGDVWCALGHVWRALETFGSRWDTFSAVEMLREAVWTPNNVSQLTEIR